MIPNDKDKPLPAELGGYPEPLQAGSGPPRRPTLSEQSSKREKDNRPAFPGHVAINSHSVYSTKEGTTGMTIRDHYKIELCKAYLNRIDAMLPVRPTDAQHISNKIARLADALLEA